jgi:L-cysteine desulfidase
MTTPTSTSKSPDRAEATELLRARVGELLSQITVPVTGCTEPAAIALATSLAGAAARGARVEWLHGGGCTEPAGCDEDLDVELVQVRTVRSLYKNGLAVGIPASEGGSGIYLAAALGPFLDPGAGLNLLKGCGPKVLARARELMGAQRLCLEVQGESVQGVFVEARVIGVSDGERHVGEATIAGDHDGVARIRRDGAVIYEKARSGSGMDGGEVLDGLAGCTLADLIELAVSLDDEARALVESGIEMNLKASRAGLSGRLGMGVGAGIQDLVDSGELSEDLPTRASAVTAGATDARMSGHEVEVMSSSGSGNQGIMAVLPVVTVSEHARAGEARTVESVALSHLVTAVMTHHAGLLSPLCGCVVKAGLGAAAGSAFALGLGEEGVIASLKNMAGNMTGEICDGAKVGCAVKLCGAARAAVLSALFARNGVTIPSNNGILASAADDLFRNIGDVARSMHPVDRTIVEIMERKQARGGVETTAG